MRAYILIEVEVGEAKAAKQELHGLDLLPTTILSVDILTGSYDLIVQLEAPDLDTLARSLTRIQQVKGLQRTMTCLVVRLG